MYSGRLVALLIVTRLQSQVPDRYLPIGGERVTLGVSLFHSQPHPPEWQVVDLSGDLQKARNLPDSPPNAKTASSDGSRFHLCASHEAKASSSGLAFSLARSCEPRPSIVARRAFWHPFASHLALIKQRLLRRFCHYGMIVALHEALPPPPYHASHPFRRHLPLPHRGVRLEERRHRRAIHRPHLAVDPHRRPAD